MRIGDLAPDFELADPHGQLHRLSDHRGRIAIINFWSCECPHVVRTDHLIAHWRENWGGRVSLVSVASNRSETVAAIEAAARQRLLPLVLIDPEHVVADAYAAVTTPQLFVLDEQGKLRYRGAVDDTSFAQRIPTRFFLEEAVQALLTGKLPPVSDTRPFGCAIIREALE